MNEIGKWTEEVHIINNNLKTLEMVTTDGELVKLHDKTNELLAMEIVNYAEQLNQKEGMSESAKASLELKKSNNIFKQAIDEYCGSFYFVFYNRLLAKDIAYQYLFRYIYLCTFSDYENRLITKKGNIKTPIYESDLQNILNLGRTETYKTKTVLIDLELITINQDKTIYINDSYCKRGVMKKNKKVGKSRMFDNAVKEIYENSNPIEHKKLALLIALLPYCNMKYNMICKNPTEEIVDCIEPYSIKELCILLKCSNVTKFKKNLLDLTVNGEQVIMFHEGRQAKIITINPRIFYSGTSIEELDWLIALFKVKN